MPCAGQCRAPAWFASNNAHCGTCDRACPTGQACSAGECRPPTPACAATGASCTAPPQGGGCCAAEAKCVAAAATSNAPNRCALPPVAPSFELIVFDEAAGSITVTAARLIGSGTGGSTAGLRLIVTLTAVAPNTGAVTIAKPVESTAEPTTVPFVPGAPSDSAWWLAWWWWWWEQGGAHPAGQAPAARTPSRVRPSQA